MVHPSETNATVKSSLKPRKNLLLPGNWRGVPDDGVVPGPMFYINLNLPLQCISSIPINHHNSQLQINSHPSPYFCDTSHPTITMETVKQAVNYVSESVQGAASGASHEANKEVAKDSNVNASTRYVLSV